MPNKSYYTTHLTSKNKKASGDIEEQRNRKPTSKNKEKDKNKRKIISPTVNF